MSTNVFFGGLPVDITREDLETYLMYHNPASMDVHQGRGIAFVQFNSPQDAAEVICTFHQKILLGRKIIVDEARNNHNRQPPRDRSSAQSAVFEKREIPESPSSVSDGPPPATPHTTPPSHTVVLKEVDTPIEGQISQPYDYLETNQKRESSCPPAQPRLPLLHSPQPRVPPPQPKYSPTQSQLSPKHARFSPYNGNGRPRSFSNRGYPASRHQSDGTSNHYHQSANSYYPNYEHHGRRS